MDNLKDFLMASVLLEEPNKLEMNMKELLEKEPFMKMLKDTVIYGTGYLHSDELFKE